MSTQQTTKTLREKQWENVLTGKSNSDSAESLLYFYSDILQKIYEAVSFDFRDAYAAFENRINIIEEKFPSVNAEY